MTTQTLTLADFLLARIADDEAAWRSVCADWADAAENPQIWPTLRQLAAPYADHPDYRPEWRA